MKGLTCQICGAGPGAIPSPKFRLRHKRKGSRACWQANDLNAEYARRLRARRKSGDTGPDRRLRIRKPLFTALDLADPRILRRAKLLTEMDESIRRKDELDASQPELI